jgi:signal transduction histidine kinase
MAVKSRRVFLRPPTIRVLVGLWVGSALLAWIILVAGWLVAEHRLTVMGDQVVGNIRALDTTRKLESAVLGYRHEDLLWYATGKEDHLQGSRDYLRSAEKTAQDLASYVDVPKEHDLWATIQARLKALQVRPEAPALTAEVQAWPASGLSDLIQDFEVQNETQMEASIQAADHLRGTVSHWTVGLAVGTAVLLLGGAVDFLRRIMRPVLSVTRAAEAFGQGDFSIRTPILHDDELGALAQTFNNMAGDIADREKDRLQFVAMVVHDLKNPVLAIDMATRVLSQFHVAQEERQSYLAGIKEEVARLRQIIRDLTDDIQVVNGRFSIRKTVVDLSTLVRRFVEAQSQAFATHEITVQTDDGCVIQADADRIERVLTNLVSNAVKYSPPHTHVSLCVEKGDSQVVLRVSDQGPGIAKEDLAVLFQPFGRGRSAHSLAEGTGMGLYVVKQIVEAHEGRIEVHSAPGHGATFQIRLPLVLAESASPVGG